MKQSQWLLLVLLGMGVVSRTRAADKLDSLEGRGWSPNNRWFAFNPPNQDNLIIASITGNQNFLLRPVGKTILDTGHVFSSAPPTNTVGVKTVGDGTLMQIGSPGHYKLEALEWSPDGMLLAYSYERGMRAVFSVFDQAVTGSYSISNSLPWKKEDELRVAFDYQRSTTNHPAQYSMRVVRPDNSLVKEKLFREPQEIARIGQLRYSGSSFLTLDRQQIIYPKFAGKQWQLVTEDVKGSEEARPLTELAESAPYEWKLSHDGKRLAVVDGPTSLTVGALDHWAQAEHVTFSNSTLTVEWSPDDRWLAANSRQQLYLLEFNKETQRIAGDLTLVANNCNPQFWGWRGARLLFGDPQQRPAELFCIDTASGKQVEQIVHSKPWQSAPVARTISPDGNTFICVCMEIDGEGRLAREIWKIRPQKNAEWELLEKSAPGN